MFFRRAPRKSAFAVWATLLKEIKWKWNEMKLNKVKGHFIKFPSTLEDVVFRVGAGTDYVGDYTFDYIIYTLYKGYNNSWLTVRLHFNISTFN